MTNKEQIWLERKAILKDVITSMLPGLVLMAIFLGVFIATDRINRQWLEGVSSRRAQVNSLAVDQLKDFAVIQAGVNELDTLPEGIDATRFKSDNEAFLNFTRDYISWDSYADMVSKRNAAAERIGEFWEFWNSIFYKIKWDRTRESYVISHDQFLTAEQLPTRKVNYEGKERRDRETYQIAMVQDIHAIEIQKDGSYLYLAIVPMYRFLERTSNPDSTDRARSMCAMIWYSCDANSVITPVAVRWTNIIKY